jgi:hypothetical protein
MGSGVSGGAGQLGLVLRKAQQIDPAREVGDGSTLAARVCLSALVLGRRQPHGDGHFVHESDLWGEFRATSTAGGVSHAINIRTG